MTFMDPEDSSFPLADCFVEGCFIRSVAGYVFTKTVICKNDFVRVIGTVFGIFMASMEIFSERNISKRCFFQKNRFGNFLTTINILPD